MMDLSQLRSKDDREVQDSNGDKIGTAGEVYTSAEGGEPEWLGINTGLFGLNESLVPLRGIRIEAKVIHIDYDKDTVKKAPNIRTDVGEPLSAAETQRLYDHYGISPEESGMTRSEQRLRLGTQRQETGKARLRKYVVTEHVQVTVPVRREEVRLEREPITDANRDEARSGPEFADSEHVVTLHEERPVVGVETVAVEQVRLATETVTEEETVEADLQREEIEADLPDSDRKRIT